MGGDRWLETWELYNMDELGELADWESDTYSGTILFRTWQIHIKLLFPTEDFKSGVTMLMLYFATRQRNPEIWFVCPAESES